jgi:hypothetical protein
MAGRFSYSIRLGEIGYRNRRVDFNSSTILIKSEPLCHAVSRQEQPPIDVFSRVKRARQQECELPLGLSGTVTNPRPSGDPWPGVIKEILTWDEAVAPQVLETTFPHPRELAADAVL